MRISSWSTAVGPNGGQVSHFLQTARMVRWTCVRKVAQLMRDAPHVSCQAFLHSGAIASLGLVKDEDGRDSSVRFGLEIQPAVSSRERLAACDRGVACQPNALTRRGVHMLANRNQVRLALRKSPVPRESCRDAYRDNDCSAPKIRGLVVAVACQSLWFSTDRWARRRTTQTAALLAWLSYGKRRLIS